MACVSPSSRIIRLLISSTSADTHTIPYHYKHPITGKDVLKEDMEALTLQEYQAQMAAANGNGATK